VSQDLSETRAPAVTAVVGNLARPAPDGPAASSVSVVQPELRFDRWFLPLSAPLGVGPKNSELRIDGGNLHVKMGWAFTADIPLTSITEVEPSNERAYSAGVHGLGSRWLVNGSRKGLVALTIEPPVPAKVWVRSVKLSKLVLSVTDPDAFIAACTGK
jgi:hypothetical protein